MNLQKIKKVSFPSKEITFMKQEEDMLMVRVFLLGILQKQELQLGDMIQASGQ
jgi:hypothetical protein